MTTRGRRISLIASLAILAALVLAHEGRAQDEISPPKGAPVAAVDSHSVVLAVNGLG